MSLWKLESNNHNIHDNFYSYDPALTYGCTKKQQVEPFRPHYVIYDKKTLKFMAYFRQHVPESRTENYRIRYVNIFYYLEDDTLEVIEPYVKVSMRVHFLSLTHVTFLNLYKFTIFCAS